MQRGTMVFRRLELLEYSVSSLTAPTPWSWPHEYAEACAFDSCFPPVTSEDHVTICRKVVVGLHTTPLSAFCIISSFLSLLHELEYTSLSSNGN